jgi:hypothetical protein
MVSRKREPDVSSIPCLRLRLSSSATLPVLKGIHWSGTGNFACRKLFYGLESYLILRSFL